MSQSTHCRAFLTTPLGQALAVAGSGGLAGFWFVGQKYFPKNMENWPEQPGFPLFGALQQWLDAYFAGKRPALDMCLAPEGTPFQRAVWDILVQIPYGGLTTYGAIGAQMAARLGKASMSAQAVGGAVGHNPISLLIPCHRVVGANGSLTGYAGGLEKKQALLRLEGALL